MNFNLEFFVAVLCSKQSFWIYCVCSSAAGSDGRLFLFQISRKDFDGFKKLFHRFLQVKGPSVDWAKINRPPEDSVSSR